MLFREKLIDCMYFEGILLQAIPDGQNLIHSVSLKFTYII